MSEIKVVRFHLNKIVNMDFSFNTLLITDHYQYLSVIHVLRTFLGKRVSTF